MKQLFRLLLLLVVGLGLLIGCQRHFGEYITAPNLSISELLQTPDKVIIDEGVITLTGNILIDKMPPIGLGDVEPPLRVTWQLTGASSVLKRVTPQWLWVVCDAHTFVAPISEITGTQKIKGNCSCGTDASLVVAFYYQNKIYRVRSEPLTVNCVY